MKTEETENFPQFCRKIIFIAAQVDKEKPDICPRCFGEFSRRAPLHYEYEDGKFIAVCGKCAYELSTRGY
jgi:hypothetical protein